MNNLRAGRGCEASQKKCLFILPSHQTLIILIVEKQIRNVIKSENIKRIHPRTIVQEPPSPPTFSKLFSKHRETLYIIWGTLQYLGRALRQKQLRGPSAANRTVFYINEEGGYANHSLSLDTRSSYAEKSVLCLF